MPTEWRGCVVRRAGRSTLYVKIRIDGRWVMRSTPYGLDEEGKAEAMLAAMRDELQARESEGLPAGAVTVRAWSARWIEDRRRLEIADAANDDQRLRDHVLPAIGDLGLDDVRPRHLVAIVDGLRAAGRAPRTVRNVYGVIRSMWRDARIADLTTNDPCILTHRQLGRVRDADPLWRDAAQFTHAELSRLVLSSEVTAERRLMWGLLGLAMLRHGELAGLRWHAVHLDAEPLGRLDVTTSYDRGRTKGRKSRRVPVHPSLLPLLAAWRLSGWAKRYGRAPEPADLVLPKPTRVDGLRTHQGTHKLLSLDLARLDLRRRRPHDLRRTGISLALDHGADESVLRWVTHGRPATVMGLYTSREWSKVCRAVEAIPALAPHGTTVVPLRANERASATVSGTPVARKSAKSRRR